ncbi:thermonuclease family protein [Micromonospora chalcea]|uniref:thermonuclease family protein n=1 Tax=Micromonospora chalcea TaxID=1874 RepID=UPI003D75C671
MSKHSWSVPATIVRVVDADTVELLLDLGWRVQMRANARIFGVDAPELSTPAGRAARDWAVQKLPVGTEVLFTSMSLDKYGRPLGILWLDGRDYGQVLVEAGHAEPYDC